MRFPINLIIAAFCFSSCSAQQLQTELSARDLYYREQAPDTQTTPGSTQGISTSQAPAQDAQTGVQTTPKPHHKSGSTTHKAPATGKSAKNGPTPSDIPSSSVQLAAQNERISRAEVLGLRYNLLLVNPNTRGSEPADPERVFQPGECIAFDLEANSSGYLYVLEKGSSGAWTPLLPSAEMAGETNVLKARTVMRIPQNHCFEITGPPGEEHVFVALSRNPEDMKDLNQLIINSAGSAQGSYLLAQNRLSDEVTRLGRALQDRDLKVKKIDKPESPGEPANSVYIVNVSATSSDRVVTEIRIQHQ